MEPATPLGIRAQVTEIRPPYSHPLPGTSCSLYEVNLREVGHKYTFDYLDPILPILGDPSLVPL